MTVPPLNGGCEEAAAPAPLGPRNHVLGLTLICLVAVIWVASSELIQFIFGASSYSKPYFLTYFSTSLFTLYLAGFLCLPSWRATLLAPPAEADVYASLAAADAAADPAGGGGAVTPRRRAAAYNAEQVRAAALVLAPIFFTSNLAFNVGLRGTSVASSSTISTLSSLFGLALGALTGVERFSLSKLASACLTVLGVAVVAWNDEKSMGRDSAVSDAVSVGSAFLYGLYATQLKKRVPDEEAASMAMMFGYLGAFVVVAGWPLLFVLHWTGAETFELPHARVIGLLALNALIGTVLSDYLWARSVALTTPVIATLALSLTLPMSVVVDYFFRDLRFTWTYFVGILLVLVGFIAANVEEAVSSSRGQS
jgi:solute carrier family 35, member F5